MDAQLSPFCEICQKIYFILSDNIKPPLVWYIMVNYAPVLYLLSDIEKELKDHIFWHFSVTVAHDWLKNGQHPKLIEGQMLYASLALFTTKSAKKEFDIFYCVTKQTMHVIIHNFQSTVGPVTWKWSNFFFSNKFRKEGRNAIFTKCFAL